MEIKELKAAFINKYNKGDVRVFSSSARVNLIGEHTDYNGGYVLPCAIMQRSACAVRVREDDIINLASTSYDKTISVTTKDLANYQSLPWGNYQLGVAHIMQKMGYTVFGMDMLFDETVPHGSGLSSSAAIEVAMATAIATLAKKNPIDYIELAVIGQKAENEYVGMNCGIMDQFASAMGKENQAILLKCSNLEYKYVPFEIEKNGYSLIIANTKKPRSLITSAYNQRRLECEQALKDICKHKVFNNLCEISLDEYNDLKKHITNETNKKRATHVIEENARTLEAVSFLSEDKIEDFCKLMIKSHVSLRDLYEVTGFELDAMFNAMTANKAFVGGRMTGAGFGGCVISITKKEDVDSFCKEVGNTYEKKTGYVPEFYIAKAANGAGEIF